MIVSDHIEWRKIKLAICFMRKIFLCMLLLCTSQVMANVVITGTRVIYPADEKEITVKLNNKGNGPVLIQTWIDSGNVNATPDDIRVPFLITPPMNRVDPHKGQTLRISYTGMPRLPDDRESVFWLNVLEIPPTKMNGAGDNKLQVAFRSRIKLFYRPASLKDDMTSAAEGIQWQVSGGKLVAVNSSPYFITLLGVQSAHGKTESPEEMLIPFGRLTFKNKKGHFTVGEKMIYQYINDWGAVKKIER